MDEVDRYGLAAQFSYTVQGNAFASMDSVVDRFHRIEQAIQQAATAIRNSGLGTAIKQTFNEANQQLARQSRTSPATQARNTQKAISQDLRAEFRALKAEYRTIEFPDDLYNKQGFQAATHAVETYIQELKRLDGQLQGTTPEVREFAAQLKRQQQVAQTKVDVVQQQRNAAIANQRQGTATAIATGAQQILNPLVQIGGTSITASTALNREMANVASLIPGNIKRVEELKGTVQGMSIALGRDTSDAANGLYEVISAFGDAADTAQKLEINSKAAAAGQAKTIDAINLTSAVTKAYNDTNATAIQKVSDLALIAVNLGQTTFPELAASVGKVTPLMANLGGTQEELFAVMATATGVTGGAAEVATQLRGALQALMAPTNDTQMLFRQMGVTSGAALIKERGLVGAITSLTDAAKTTRKPLQSYISSIEGQTLALALSGTQSEDYKTKLQAMQNAAGTTDKAFREQTQGMNKAGFMLAQLNAAYQVMTQQVGDALTPVLAVLVTVIKNLVSAFVSLPKPVRNAIVLTGAVAAGVLALTAVIATGAAAFFGLQAAIATATVAMSGAIPLTGFFATAMSAFSTGGIVAGVTAAFGSLATGVGAAGAAVMAFATGPVGLLVAAGLALYAILETLTPGFNVLGAVLSAIAAPIGYVFGLVKGIAGGIIETFKPLVKDLAPLGQAFSGIGEALKMAAQAFGFFGAVGEQHGRMIGTVIGTFIVTPVRLVIGLIKLLSAAFRSAGTVANAVFNPISWLISSVTSGIALLSSAVGNLFGANILGAVIQRVQNFLELPLVAVRDRIMRAWQEMVSMFYSILAPIVEPAVTVAQQLIAALNCHPTIVIPESWKLAIDQIMGWLFGWVGSAQEIGRSLVQALNPGQLKQKWQGLQQNLPQWTQKMQTGMSKVSNWWEKHSPMQKPAAVKVATEVIPPVEASTPLVSNSPILPPLTLRENVQKELKQAKQTVATGMSELGAGWQDRMGLLQQQADPTALVTPDLEQVKNSLSTLQGDFAHFGEQAKQSLLKLDFHQLWQDTKDFGGNFAAAAKQIVAGFGSMSLSAVAFGAYSLLSLSPVVLVLGGMTLAAIALATNFLGLRNILVGSIKIIVGTVQALYSVIRGLVEIIVGAGNVIGGVLSALRGDFSQLHQGAQQVMVGIHTIADGVATGLKTGLGGALQLLKGLFEGLGQIANTVFNTLGFATKQVLHGVQTLGSGIRILGEVLVTAIIRPQELWQGFLNLLSQIQSKVKAVIGAIGDSTVGKLTRSVGLGQAAQAPAAEVSTEKPGFFRGLFQRKPKESATPIPAAPISTEEPPPVVQSASIPTATVVAPKPVVPQTGKLGADQIEAQGKSYQQTVQSVSNSVSALSGVAATFAPTIAGPIFAVSTLFDSFTALSQLLPTVSGFMATLGITSTTTGLKVATSGGIMAVVTGGLSTAFGALGTAATVAWAAITGPLLPIIAIIGLVAVAVMALWKAFQSNFMGIRDQVGRVWGSIQQLGRGILSVLGGALEFVGKVLLAPVALILKAVTQAINRIVQVAAVFQGELGKLWQELKNLGRVIVEPFMPLLNLFGKGGSGILGGAISATLAVIMVPLRLVAFILTVIIRSVSFLIQGFIKLGSIIATVVLAPVRMVVGVVQGIVSFIQTIGQVLLAPFQLIAKIFSSIAQFPVISNLLSALFPKQTPQPQTQPPGFASGGLIQGPGTGTSDSVHIRASRNEFVMPAKQTLQNYGFLEAIRQGMDVESALQLMPTTPPPAIIPPPPASGGNAAGDRPLDLSGLPPVTIHIENLIIDGGGGKGGPEMAYEFLDAIEPELQQRLRQLLRDMVEKSK